MRIVAIVAMLLSLQGCALAVGALANSMGAKPAYGVGTDNQVTTADTQQTATK